MGKTIMLSSLIQTSLASSEAEEQSIPQTRTSKQLRLDSAFRAVNQRKAQSSKPPSATLVVAPTSLLNQWSEELLRSCKPGKMKVEVWHGQNRSDLEGFLEDDDDEGGQVIKVVITSYGILASEHAKMEKASSSKSPIYDGT